MIFILNYTDAGWVYIADNVQGKRIGKQVIILFQNYLCTTSAGWNYQFTLPADFRPATFVFDNVSFNDIDAQIRIVKVAPNGGVDILKPEGKSEELLGCVTYFV